MSAATTDWIAQLAPAHAPLPPAWWPLAAAWWVLLFVLMIMLGAFIYKQTRPHTQLRRLALRELKRLQAEADDDTALARDLEHLLRRYAVARFGRDSVSALSGERWITFVVEHGGVSWLGGAGTNLLRLAYGGEATPQREAWLNGARGFIKGRT